MESFDKTQDKQKITIFTDGSSLGNPGPGGYGAIIVLKVNDNSAEIQDSRFKIQEVTEIGGYEKETTNNRMEMIAIIDSLIFVSDKYPESEVIIFTDSSYTLNGITKWVHGWKKNGWKTSAKEDVLNIDLWQRLYDLVYEKGLAVEFKKIAGHAGIVGNERADLIATSFAEKNPIELFEGSLKGYEDMVGESLLEIPEITHEHPKRSHQKAYSYVSLVDGKIETHKTWADCENRVKGVSGAKYKKTINKKDEEEIIKDWQQTLF